MSDPTISNDTQDRASPWRRRIELSGRDGEMRLALEDQFHRFRLTIHHSSGRVTGFTPETLRAPTTICPMAGAALDSLVGMTLPDSPLGVTAVADPRENCTHLIDLAALGMAAAARGVRRRSYRAEIVEEDERTVVASLRRDDVVIMAWKVGGSRLVQPSGWSGVKITSGFTQWVAETLHGDDVEAALILRRAILTSHGRKYPREAEIPTSTSACWALQPNRVGVSRTIGSMRDFGDREEALGRDDEQWMEWAAS